MHGLVGLESLTIAAFAVPTAVDSSAFLPLRLSKVLSTTPGRSLLHFQIKVFGGLGAVDGRPVRMVIIFLLLPPTTREGVELASSFIASLID